MKANKSFNIRVYGLLVEEYQVLISHEVYDGRAMTKFPGGGLEWGEGFKETLQREFMEELELDIQVGALFHLTEEFVASAFNPNDQLISIYYFVHRKDVSEIRAVNPRQRLEWMPIESMNPNQFTFPIDRLVAEKMKRPSSRAY